MLELRSVSWKSRRGFEIRNVSLALQKGSLTCVMGPNGSGKSTLLRLMTGEIMPDSGEALMDGVSISRISRREFARKAAVIRQERSFAFPMTCRELVMTGRAPYLGFMGLSGKREQEMALRVMEKTGSLLLADAPFEEISGGEKQRVLLARSLMQQPETLLMDEAFSAMDARQSVNAMQLVKRLAREEQMAVMCIIHDIHLAHAFADRIVLMDAGEIAADGAPDEIMTGEAMKILTGMEISLSDGRLSTFIPREG